MNSIERQREVKTLLEGMGNPAASPADRYDKLCRLFWSDLNYNRVSQPLPRHGWPASAAQALADDPVLFAAGGQDEAFHVIYARLASDRLLLGRERPVVSRLLRDHPYSLFVFSTETKDQWHFLNVKYDEKSEKRRLFRRITVGPEDRLRTASERLTRLDVESGGPGLFGIAPLELQRRHDEAFDVEAVTKQFWEEYKAVYEILQDDLRRQAKDREWAHDYALQFLNRCMFLYFIQRKRWLGADTEFLGSFWGSYRSSGQPKDSFFTRWLSVLFFEAFNNKFHGGHRQFPEPIKQALALAPYLNGGLFLENELDRKHSCTVSDARFAQVFTFLERYNFTISEDSPLDQEVAVDPEMMGKVYESLVNFSTEADERGNAGIFYTPRTEIDLMCRLALVDHLANHVGVGRKNLLYEAVLALEPDEKASADRRVANANLWPALDELLRGITVLDPACGSGSFLVGMLHVLENLQARAATQLGTAEPSYDRKKRIIGQSLYGVDVMDWACHVAELRLWLALVVDAHFEVAELHIRPEPLLPHFTFKIRCGDSLVQEVGGINLGHVRSSHLIPAALKARITRLKSEKLKFYNNDPTCQYRSAQQAVHGELRLFRDILDARHQSVQEEIKSLKRKAQAPAERQVRLDGSLEERADQLSFEASQFRKRIEGLEDETQRIAHARSALKTVRDVPFVWDIAFVEVFEGDKEGFDIVVGNPPYVRTQSITDPLMAKGTATADDNRDYKAKLARSVYQAFPRHFGYKSETDKATRKLDAKSDLYVYFYLLGLSLLNSGGSFCFITSNSWLDVGYGAGLQEFLLRHCRVNMVLDNQARRSFASADVNTVIVSVSSPGESADCGLGNTARFVMFKAPFEQVLSPVIFQEIEAADERRLTPEYRVFPISQRELLTMGSTPEHSEAAGAASDGEKGAGAPLVQLAPYSGDKWGGMYLRAPDILFISLAKGKDKLKPMASVASILTYLILPRKADQVLVLSEDEVPSELRHCFRPFVRSPRYFDTPWVKKAPHWVLCCSVEDVARSKALRHFVRSAERRLEEEFDASPDREDWYVVRQEPAPILWQRRFGERHIVFYNPNGFLSYDFYRVYPRCLEYDGPMRLAGVMMSTLFWLFKELFGRTNLGEGALKTEGTDLARMHVLDPNRLAADALSAVSSLLRRPALRLEEELRQADRVKLDMAICRALGLSEAERETVSDSVRELVNSRSKKAVSLP